MEVDACAKEAVSVALQASPEGEVRLQISPSQGPQGPRQGHASGLWATQQHHRGDLSFLDPVNMADCPPKVSARCSCACCMPGLVSTLLLPACVVWAIKLPKLRKLHYRAATWLLEELKAQCPLCQLLALPVWFSLESFSDVQAVRLAAGELVLRIREEQRRRAIGNVCAASMQTRRMTGNKPGAPCSDASQHAVTWWWPPLQCYLLYQEICCWPLSGLWQRPHAPGQRQQCLVEAPLCSAGAFWASVPFFCQH